MTRYNLVDPEIGSGTLDIPQYANHNKISIHSANKSPVHYTKMAEALFNDIGKYRRV